MLNTRLLRDMAGSMTATSMEMLFKPPPFGEPGPTRTFDPANLDTILVWDLFRNIDCEKQSRVLEVITR